MKLSLIDLFCFIILTSGMICEDSTTIWLSKLEKKIELNTKEIESNKKTIMSLKKENHLLKSKLAQEYCQTLSDDTCGPCQCRDDDRLLKKYYCDCQNLQPKRDCLEFYQYGIKINGIYKVHQNILKIIQVYCDQETDNGGWTVFQRRVDGSVNFHRDWKNYKFGFGQLQNEFWLGNENIFTMSLHGLYPRGNELRIDLKNLRNLHQYAKYKDFQIGNEKTKYLIHIGTHSGTAEDRLTYHNGQKFTTFDADNDKYGNNCATTFKSAWWFNSCFEANLNGQYHYGGKVTSATMGIHWGIGSSFHNRNTESLLFTEMKLRRIL